MTAGRQGGENTIYSWVDGVPLSRPKRNIARDFSDGVLAAEIVHHHLPRLVELHNYAPANSVSKKLANWNTLNVRVFKKLGFTIQPDVIEAVANAETGAIEGVLQLLRTKIANYVSRKAVAKSKGLSETPTTKEGRGSISSAHDQATHHAPVVVEQCSLSPTGVEAREDAENANCSSDALGNKTNAELSGASSAVRPPSASAKVAGEAILSQLSELQVANQSMARRIVRMEELLRLRDIRIQVLTTRLKTLERQHQDEPDSPLYEEDSSLATSTTRHRPELDDIGCSNLWRSRHGPSY